MRSEPRQAAIGLRVAAWGGLAFLHIPLALIVLYAFSAEDKSYVFPPPALTTDWFAVAMRRDDVWRAIILSLQVAACSTAIALVLGTLAAALARTRFFGRDAITLLLVLPIALPGIITGILLRSGFNSFDIPFSFWTIVIGHATFCVVVVYNNAVARLRRMSPSLIGSVDGSRSGRLSNLALCGRAAARLGVAGRRAARLRAQLRRGDRHHPHSRPADHPAYLDAAGVDPPAATPSHQRRRGNRHRADIPADPRSVPADTPTNRSAEQDLPDPQPSPRPLARKRERE